jgi:hypothetical protein
MHAKGRGLRLQKTLSFFFPLKPLVRRYLPLASDAGAFLNFDGARARGAKYAIFANIAAAPARRGVWAGIFRRERKTGFLISPACSSKRDCHEPPLVIS